MSSGVTLTVSDSLGGSVGDVEALHALADRRQPAERFVLDMDEVSFVRPPTGGRQLAQPKRCCCTVSAKVSWASTLSEGPTSLDVRLTSNTVISIHCSPRRPVPGMCAKLAVLW